MNVFSLGSSMDFAFLDSGFFSRALIPWGSSLFCFPFLQTSVSLTGRGKVISRARVLLTQSLAVAVLRFRELISARDRLKATSLVPGGRR